MKVTFIGHASILIEAGGKTVLSDPWWRGPCFGAQWWVYPQPFLKVLESIRLDYIYISHGHHDHFHPATLRMLSRDATVLVSRNIGLGGAIRDIGFSVVELGDDEEYALGGAAACRIMRTHGDDTMMALSHGGETCVNLNDSLHSAPPEVQDRFFALLRELYPRIDYLFCGYGVASHFPNCYSVPGKNRELSGARRQMYFNRQWARIVHGLAPRFAFPFAADVVFFERDLQWVNEPVHNHERPTAALAKLYPGTDTRTYDVAPGFSIESGKVLSKRLRAPISIDTAIEECADAVARANSYGSASVESITEVKTLLDDNIARCSDYLRSFPGDYRFRLDFRNGGASIEIAKVGNRIATRLITGGRGNPDGTCDVTYLTRVAYLRQSLTTEFGHEILFVGSGGIFEYADAARTSTNVHRELMVMLRCQREALPARPRGLHRLANRLKRTVKSALGSSELDLYDLSTWTVFEGVPSQHVRN